MILDDPTCLHSSYTRSPHKGLAPSRFQRFSRLSVWKRHGSSSEASFSAICSTLQGTDLSLFQSTTANMELFSDLHWDFGPAWNRTRIFGSNAFGNFYSDHASWPSKIPWCTCRFSPELFTWSWLPYYQGFNRKQTKILKNILEFFVRQLVPVLLGAVPWKLFLDSVVSEMDLRIILEISRMPIYFSEFKFYTG